MNLRENLELLQAVLAVASADEKISRAETGVIQSLAERAGLGRMSLDAMVQRARSDPTFRDELTLSARKDATRVVTLLVGVARLDHEISTEERTLLVTLAQRLGVTGPRFEEAYRDGIRVADDLRRQRQPPPRAGSNL